MISRRAAMGTFAALTLSLAACGRDAGETADSGSNDSTAPAKGGAQVRGSIKGAGATSQSDAQDAWMNAFMDANPDADVQYGGGGSGAGREKFLAGAVDFCGSDSAMKDEELATAGDIIEVPAYISPIAICYKLAGFEGDNHVQMSASTVAKVFSGAITSWDAPEIAADNPGVTLPSTPIIVVHRSDKSGTTKNFTDFLSKAAPQDWTNKAEEVWPFDGQSGDGTSGMVTTVAGAEGAIGYADESKVDTSALGTISVGLEGTFVPPSAQAAAKALEASKPAEGATDTVMAYSISRNTAGTYPVILVSYLIAHQKYDDADIADTVKAYLSYCVSEEGQQQAHDKAGSAPLTDALRTKVMAAVETIQ
ncbi:phosphate ABC transporter substrate-binding protein PstS [Actinomyces vulturis]|uniref:phosphate ABC transporter substrate-binding protein PstS n=1 Tax=Actinomyces vulturis TaxID=1857645 RepID=UPI000834DF37|nr:phosphate ABC transporter substrate-binding protein PstS [Actinomyces vulturis]